MACRSINLRWKHGVCMPRREVGGRGRLAAADILRYCRSLPYSSSNPGSAGAAQQVDRSVLAQKVDVQPSKWAGRLGANSCSWKSPLRKAHGPIHQQRKDAMGYERGGGLAGKTQTS